MGVIRGALVISVVSKYLFLPWKYSMMVIPMIMAQYIGKLLFFKLIYSLEGRVDAEGETPQADPLSKQGARGRALSPSPRS